MNDPIPLHIISIFLVVLSVLWTKTVWAESGFTRSSISIRPLSFLFSSVLGLLFVMIITLAIGVQYLGLALGIGYAFLVCLAHPVAAISVLTSFLVIRPWEMHPDPGAMSLLPRLLAVCAMASWLFHSFRKGAFRVVWTTPCTILFCFVIWLLTSAFISGDLENVATVFSAYLPTTVVFFLILNVPRTTESIDTVVRSVIVSVAAMISVALYASLTYESAYTGDRLIGLGMMGNANDLAACIVFALPLLFFQVARSGKLSFFKPQVLLYILVMLASLWLSQSRGAIVALAAATFVYFVFDVRSSKSFVFIAAAIVAMPLYYFFGIAREASDLAVSSESRMGYLIAGLRMFKENPVFGVGVYNYPKFYDRFATVFVGELGEPTAHSSWVLAAAEAGFPGLFLFVIFYFYALKKSWEIRRTRPEFFYALIAYAVAISFLSHTYMFFPYLLAGLALCAVRLLKPAAKEGGEAYG